MKKILTLLISAIFCILANAQNQERILQNDILRDAYLEQAYQLAKATVATGLNAGSGYGEVWIRDFNTFITTAMEVMPDEKIRETLDIFFHFQEEDGNIVDGYIPISQADLNNVGGYAYRLSKTCPAYAAHKNTVETDQETSLVQAVYQYVQKSGNRDYLETKINDVTVRERLAMAMQYLMNHRYNEKYGLIYGATTADWGDVQPEHEWGVYLTDETHYAIDIYDNAMFVLALNQYIDLIQENTEQEYWRGIRDQIKKNVRQYLWDDQHQKFIPHLYLNGSPFPENFDENQIYYHGGTAVAALAGLLSKEEIAQANKKMLENVRKAHAETIGLTMYPTYPAGYFKGIGMYPYGYQNGGDWTWFGARMIWALIQNGQIKEAYDELLPMLKRVIRNRGFNEWYTPAGEPKGSGTFRGEAGVLATAIEMLRDWARTTDAVPMEEMKNTTVIFAVGQSNAANWSSGSYKARTKVLNYYDGQLYPAADPIIGANGAGASPWPRLGDLMNESGFADGVTIICPAVGGTRINQWVDGQWCNYVMVKSIEKALEEGIHIDYILWHQGESDLLAGTSKEDYIRDFLKVREEFRSRGIDAPILIAQASYCPLHTIISQGAVMPKNKKDLFSKEVRAAQKELVRKYDDIYAGPDTDRFVGIEDRAKIDLIHFSETGLEKHAAAWFKKIKKVK